MGSAIALYIGTLVFILGLSIGSFLNVCIYRIPEKMSIVNPGSHCPKCGHNLSALELIPVLSYLFLRGRCKICKTPIAIRYPLVEMLTGLLFVGVFVRWGISWNTPVLWLLTAILVTVAFIDYDHRRIPNVLVVFGIVIGIAVAWMQLAGVYTVYDAVWTEAILGVFIPSALLFSVVVITGFISGKPAIGMGDVKIYLVIGLFLGLKLTLLSLWLTFLLGGIFSVFGLILKSVNRHTELPFGPFIAIGAFLSALYGAQVIGFIGL